MSTTLTPTQVQSLIPTLQLSEIAKAKTQAGEALVRYVRLISNMQCHHDLAQYLNPLAAEAAENFDNAMERLAELDPTCPGWSRLRAAA